LVGTQTTARPGAVELTVIYGDALIESINHKVKDSYKNVYVIRSEQDVKDYDYILSVSNSITSSCGATSCGVKSKTLANLSNPKKNILQDYNFEDDFVWEEPGSAVACGIFSGLSLFIAAPILIPLAVDIECEELRHQISNSNDRVASKIAATIVDTSLSGVVLTQSNIDQTSIRLEKIKALFDKGLITKDDFEVKRKEILSGI
jgi:hypothetical protein